MKRNKKKLNNKGFSLVELIVVIAIMAILVGVLAPQAIKYVGKSRTAADGTNIDNIKSAVNVALADEAAYNAIPATGLTFTIQGAVPTEQAYKDATAFKAELEKIITTWPTPKESTKTDFKVVISADKTVTVTTE